MRRLFAEIDKIVKDIEAIKKKLLTLWLSYLIQGIDGGKSPIVQENRQIPIINSSIQRLILHCSAIALIPWEVFGPYPHLELSDSMNALDFDNETLISSISFQVLH